MKVTRIRHSYTSPDGENVHRPEGMEEYSFFHFYQDMDLLVDGEIIHTEPHAVILFDMHTPQYYRNPAPLVHDWLHWEGALPSILQTCNIAFNTVYYPSNPAFITELIYKMETEFYSRQAHCDLLMKNAFEELVIKLSRSLQTPPMPNLSLDMREKMQQIRGKALSYLELRMTIPEMAAFVELSPSHFYKLYKALYGVSPIDDAINARITKAQELLFLKNMSVSEIAHYLGYANTTHFIRQFKSRTGVSPTEYKKGITASSRQRSRIPKP